MEQSAGVGQFWTPIMAVGGSLLHADLQPQALLRHFRLQLFFSSLAHLNSFIKLALVIFDHCISSIASHSEEQPMSISAVGG